MGSNITRRQSLSEALAVAKLEQLKHKQRTKFVLAGSLSVLTLRCYCCSKLMAGSEVSAQLGDVPLILDSSFHSPFPSTLVLLELDKLAVAHSCEAHCFLNVVAVPLQCKSYETQSQSAAGVHIF